MGQQEASVKGSSKFVQKYNFLAILVSDDKWDSSWGDLQGRQFSAEIHLLKEKLTEGKTGSVNYGYLKMQK